MRSRSHPVFPSQRRQDRPVLSAEQRFRIYGPLEPMEVDPPIRLGWWLGATLFGLCIWAVIYAFAFGGSANG